MILSSGTVTFFFTDIEGSTDLWERYPEEMRVALARHDTLLRQAVERNDGAVFKTVGDAICASFLTAPDALSAAVESQWALLSEPWPEPVRMRVRMALHTGAAELRDNDFFGQPLNRTARLLSAAHGGQILLSLATQELVRDSLPDKVTLRDMGVRRLKDLSRPEHVFQVVAPDIPSDFPPLKTLDTNTNNLPVQLTNFVGRESEMEELKGLMGSSRLVTLTGAGGSGKTRLALQVGANHFDHFPDGVWLTEFAQVTDENLVPQEMAKVLWLRDQSGRSLTDALNEHLKSKNLLLIMDNCEHLLTACSRLAESLLHHCPGVHILATSREAMGVSGEVAFRVPSLSMPDPKRDLTPESLSMFESVRLFVERAKFRHPQFAVTNDNAPALASICFRLDGIPLAIELAAARMTSMSLEEVDHRLDQRFRLLTGGFRTALPRQQTLRSLIDWSYDLLNDSEKTMLSRLSVFSGGWTLEEAEQVCIGEDDDGWDGVNLLTSLVDKSLVTTEEKSGATRYRLLETMRQYARERLLERGEASVCRDRHLEYFMSLAERTEPHLSGADQQPWLERLESGHDNMRTALEWSCDDDARTERGLRLAGALCRFWTARGFYGEGRGWFSALLDSDPHGQAAGIRAKALNGAGVLAWHQGDHLAARSLCGESLSISKDVGDTVGIARALMNLGLVAHVRGEYSTGAEMFQESLSILRGIGDKWGSSIALNNLGNVAFEQGEFAAARVHHEQSLAIRRELGDQRGIGGSLGNLALVAHRLGELHDSSALHRECLAIFRDLGDRRAIAYTLTFLGVVVGEQGDRASARALYKESLTLFRELGDIAGVAVTFEGVASLLATDTEPARAACVWGTAERLREDIGTPMPPNERPDHERKTRAARTAMGDDPGFDRAWQRGRTSTLEESIEDVLAFL